jgi:hypothetical protein
MKWPLVGDGSNLVVLTVFPHTTARNIELSLGQGQVIRLAIPSKNYQLGLFL